MKEKVIGKLAAMKMQEYALLDMLRRREVEETTVLIPDGEGGFEEKTFYKVIV